MMRYVAVIMIIPGKYEGWIHRFQQKSRRRFINFILIIPCSFSVSSERGRIGAKVIYYHDLDGRYYVLHEKGHT